jgi:FkbM family methyltransferase
MNLIGNAKTLLSNREVAWNYLSYWGSKLRNSGQAIRILPDNIKVTGLSGFSEFHSCSQYLGTQERDFLKNYAIGSGELIDIGANLGVISILLAKRFPERQVHSFEPNLSTFQSLQANVTINCLTNIQAQQCAVAEHNGEVFFNADPIYRATCGIATSGDQNTVSVPCTTLDSYIEKQSIKEIAFLKVDVEGYEALVFQGAESMLKRQQAKLIYYEICPVLTQKAGFDPALPTRILLRHGYQINKLNNQGLLVPVNLNFIEKLNLENWIAIRS